MIIPHYDAILHSIGTSRKDLQSKSDVRIPITLFKFLLSAVLKEGVFNEAGYLAQNPDVAAAVKRGKVKSGKEHYLLVGFFEGRRGALPFVDEAWYLRVNPDIASAVKKKELQSAQQHYDMIGAEELRAPTREYLSDCHTWKTVLGKAISKPAGAKAKG